MTYLVNDIFYTLQGEGFWTGRPAVFCRFAKCNLWSGIEADRATAICTFCDTEFVNYEQFSLDQLISEITLRWPGGGSPMVVFTGGDPLLQLDSGLTRILREQGWYVAIETNGTKRVTVAVDWICVSPKTPTIIPDCCDELKLVYPQQRITPTMFQHIDAEHFWLSPMDGPNLAANTDAAIAYCLANPRWRLNVQTHKVIGVK